MMQVEPKTHESELVQSLLDSFQDAAFLIDVETRTIVACNATCERTFGYLPNELVGRSTEFLHVDQSHFERFALDTESDLLKHGVASQAFKMRRVDGSVFDTFHRVLLATDTDGRRFAISFVWDSGFGRGPKHPEWLARIISPGVRQAADLPAAMRVLVESICRAYGWPFGECWFPRRDQTLEYAMCWHEKSEVLAEFSKTSQRFVFSPGSGLIGRVSASKATEWIENLHDDEDHGFERVIAAHRAGLKTTVGFPVMWNKNILAVIMLADPRVRHLDPEMQEEIESTLHLLENDLGAQSMTVRVAESVVADRPGLNQVATASIFSSSPIPMTIFDANTLEIIDCNSAACRALLEARNDVSGKRVSEVFAVPATPLYDIEREMRSGLELAILPARNKKKGPLNGPAVLRHVIWNGVAALGMAVVGWQDDDNESGEMPDGARRLNRLTQREQEVLAHLLKHESNKQIARHLSVSHRTVAAHRSMILQKFNAAAVHEVIGQISKIFH
ncbi:MAG: LuxR C-terminal-related transcriptional regulator [Rhodospirillales bacterium]